MLEVVKSTLTDDAIVGAIFSSIVIIILGIYLRKKNLLGESISKALSDVVLCASLPALAFTSFMKDIDQKQLHEGISILIWGFVVYIGLIFVTKIMYIRMQGEKQDVYRVLTIFGSTTFFGIPIVASIYGDVGAMYANIFNISYRVFLYSYAFIKMSGLKMDRENLKQNVKNVVLNPIVIATFVGLFIWIFQDKMPQVAVQTGDTVQNYAFLRIDKTVPWLFKPLTYLDKLASPLSWLSIGTTLAAVPFKTAVGRKDVWGYSLIKVIVVPIICLAGLMVLINVGLIKVSFVGVAMTVLMMCSPTATVAASYAISFDKEAVFTSECSFLSTFVAVVAMPIFIVALEVMKNMGFIPM
ncbi:MULTISPECIES: AEC family transporter [Clostridium]|uniref:Malate permease n=1 Tax=Clostridium cadaveris TaxID=1529 RepID=A0A1I2MW65_9CLOT|nr:AEC family transporter [Clostridium cadaveris]MDU4953437.1 AEC family transporter [Clostridium sp.]MDM8313433.1 AEC family transporter [Clostridium cadaveris]NME65357.1 AEC family transporter [Clostridium cadaveris]NWK11834.1 AEC family transporter [Clostridium cadaveris]PWL54878.1 MAG: malate permease [Clostridium cadaveris]